MQYAEYFKDKKVTVMRIGLLGRGVGDVAYMAEAGAKITVVDAASQDVMQASVDALDGYENVTFKFGPYDFADFKHADFVWVGAGAPLNEPVLMQCRESGVPLKQSAALFAELAGIPIIGVTGTRGKSTVTMMIHHVLSMITGEEILLGGNIRGVSNLQLLKQVQADSIAVMELDSWQLQGWGWSEMSPQVAVFTNFMEDHLNYYQQDGMSKEEAMEVYFADKANILRYQEESGTLVTTPEVFDRAKSLKSANGRISLGQEVILADASVIPEDALLAMPGEHNRLNAALAYEALKATGLTEEEIFEGLATFPGVEGRLQLVQTIDNVRIYNDNNSTTPQATEAALAALDVGNQNIVLIVGGTDKNIPLADLVSAIRQHCKQVILTPGTGTDRLKEAFSSQSDQQTVSGNGGTNTPIDWSINVESLEQALAEARLTAKNGDIILFSPAFASFSQYKNEYERNDEFMSLIKNL